MTWLTASTSWLDPSLRPISIAWSPLRTDSQSLSSQQRTFYSIQFDLSHLPPNPDFDPLKALKEGTESKEWNRLGAMDSPSRQRRLHGSQWNASVSLPLRQQALGVLRRTHGKVRLVSSTPKVAQLCIHSHSHAKIWPSIADISFASPSLPSRISLIQLFNLVGSALWI